MSVAALTGVIRDGGAALVTASLAVPSICVGFVAGLAADRTHARPISVVPADQRRGRSDEQTVGRIGG